MQYQLQLQRIKAVSHPMGNRVDVEWLNPRPDLFAGVRVVSRTSTYPDSPEGEYVAEAANPLLFIVDSYFKNELDINVLSPGLLALFLAHKQVLSIHAAVSVIEPGTRWQVSENDQVYVIIKQDSGLEVYGMAAAKDINLQAEEVYYYTLFPYKTDPADPSKKTYIFDRHNRVSAMATGPYDFAGQMYRMLPAIYHRYDTLLPKDPLPGMPEEDRKKGQLRRFLDLPGTQLDMLYSFATAALDFHNILRVDGKLLPLLAQWIGWDTDYNIDIARQRNELRFAPALYETLGIIPAIESIIVKFTSGWESRTKEFIRNLFFSNHPERLNLWLYRRTRGPDGRWLESPDDDVFSVDYAYEGRPAACRDKTEEKETFRLFYHTLRNGRWDIWYKNYFEGQGWTPSQPFTDTGTINKYPTVAQQDESLWVFWSSYNEEEKNWGIRCKKRTYGKWLEPDDPDNKDKLPGSPHQRKSPQAVVDHKNRLWLFWLEKEKQETRWRLKYNRHNNEKWESGASIDFPLDGTDDSRVEKDLFVLFQTDPANNHHCIWVFWARRNFTRGAGQPLWEIAYREKTGIDSIEKEWGPVRILPKDPRDTGYDDCEPAAIVYRQDHIQYFELYWTSNRSGSWSLWNTKLENNGSIDLNTAEMLIDDPYSQRTPLPLMLDNGISLIYRSNRSITYKSDIYRSTRTTDIRYAGSTTVDTRNQVRLSWLGRYEDFQTYTYTTGKNGIPTNDDWYARDTIGLYLKPDTDDQQLITRSQELVKGILHRLLPIQIRPIFIIEPPIYREMVYTYDFPGEEKENPRRIDEQVINTITIPSGEVYPGAADNYRDRVPAWISIHSWSLEFPHHHTADLSTTPVDTNFRTLHLGLRQFAAQHNIGFPPEEYTGSGDKYEDNVPGWIWIRSWSKESQDHHTVDLSTTPVDTKFRTRHIGVKK